MYEWENDEVPDGVIYWYWLESVDCQRNVIRFGPVTAIYCGIGSVCYRAGDRDHNRRFKLIHERVCFKPDFSSRTSPVGADPL